MLESSDYSNKEGSYSFIAFDELSTIEIKDYQCVITTRNKTFNKTTIDADIVENIDAFLSSIQFVHGSSKLNGVFGFSSFEAIKYFEEGLYDKKKSPYNIPDVKYSFYRFILLFDHFKNQLTIIENCPEDEASHMENIIDILERQDVQTFAHEIQGQAISDLSDEDFKKIVTTCKQHCQQGDVFQIVPSQKYTLSFSGDEFNIYRKLRSINPSPYLFYFDYVNYKLFGSSPEAQVIVENGFAEVHPIAGTIRRTMDVEQDAANSLQLLNDPKENAEHIMLVDLARNDLSKNTTEVEVMNFKEVQYFSHVIHLVSRVKGRLKEGISAYRIFADTFPQGTLSGAPKIKAIELLESMEKQHRGHYGGAIGMMGFNNELNHAIIIRSLLSYENTLHLQAGAGIVIDSQEALELKEVNNKLAALLKAIN